MARDRKKKRSIPGWAADLVDLLVQKAPIVVTREHIKRALSEVGSSMQTDAAIKGLVRRGWLGNRGVRGTWAFFPPGVDDLADPYLGLHGWLIIRSDVRFLLAGSSAAWHLGYLTRMPVRPMIWLGREVILPKALEGLIDTVRTPFPERVDLKLLEPSMLLLRKKNLDLLTWSARLPSFGPEALLVQIASRPASFASWADLVARFDEFVRDIDIKRLRELLVDAKNTTRQRAVYLLRLGQRYDATDLLPPKLQTVRFGTKGPALWDPVTAVHDHMVAPLLNVNAKA